MLSTSFDYGLKLHNDVQGRARGVLTKVVRSPHGDWMDWMDWMTTQQRVCITVLEGVTHSVSLHCGVVRLLGLHRNFVNSRTTPVSTVSTGFDSPTEVLCPRKSTVHSVPLVQPSSPLLSEGSWCIAAWQTGKAFPVSCCVRLPVRRECPTSDDIALRESLCHSTHGNSISCSVSHTRHSQLPQLPQALDFAE